MKINHLIVFLLLLAATGCASTRKSAEIAPTFVASESTWLYRDAEVVNRRLKPLERPQVRFDVEHAILHGDSVWVVVRATIPHRSIRRGECFKAISVLQASEGIMELGGLSLDSGHFMPDDEGDVDVTTRPGRMQNLYLSWRFAWDERMRMNTFIVVFASLTDGRHANDHNEALDAVVVEALHRESPSGGPAGLRRPFFLHGNRAHRITDGYSGSEVRGGL